MIVNLFSLFRLGPTPVIVGAHTTWNDMLELDSRPVIFGNTEGVLHVLVADEGVRFSHPGIAGGCAVITRIQLNEGVHKTLQALG